MKCENVRKQIERLTSELIECGLCVDQNYPSIKKMGNSNKITISTEYNSIMLKKIPYLEIYEALSINRAYNIKLCDGGLLLLQYEFRNDILQSSRLSFFPAPNYAEFQNDPSMYMNDFTEQYLDNIRSENIVAFPIRFDFDADENVFREYYHSYSHLTLGQYKNCRIPVVSPVSPYIFLHFIIKNFYDTDETEYSKILNKDKISFHSTICKSETEIIHVNFAHT